MKIKFNEMQLTEITTLLYVSRRFLMQIRNILQ